MSVYNKITAVLLIIAGLLCIIFPFASSIALEVGVGACLIVGAIAELFNMPLQKGVWDKLTALIFAIIYAIGGYLLLTNIFEGILAINIVLGAMFLVQGLYLLIMWAKLKGRKRISFWQFFNGLISVVLGFLMLTNLLASMWVIGTFLGINMILAGLGLFSVPCKECSSDS